jgi:GTPase SAR1 family protein
MTERPYFVLMGDVGCGKSTICEKLTGIKGLSSKKSTSYTKDSKVFLVENKYWLADTPGLKSIKERLDHALNLLGALRYRPLTCFLVVCSMKDRIDGLIVLVNLCFRFMRILQRILRLL